MLFEFCGFCYIILNISTERSSHLTYHTFVSPFSSEMHKLANLRHHNLANWRHQNLSSWRRHDLARRRHHNLARWCHGRVKWRHRARLGTVRTGVISRTPPPNRNRNVHLSRRHTVRSGKSVSSRCGGLCLDLVVGRCVLHNTVRFERLIEPFIGLELRN